MKIRLGILAAVLVFMMTFSMVYSWIQVPVKDDQNLFMPGTQPGDAGNSESPDKCDNCHGGYDLAIEPAYNWRGSMMAQSARDPLWLACLTTALQDSIWATGYYLYDEDVGNPNAGDICIRCHSPTGWLEGRSDPTNTAALKTSDFDGVQCDFCHRLIDPFTELSNPNTYPLNDPTEQSMAEETYSRDISVLSSLELFDGTPFLNTDDNLPTFYGDGELPNYTENAGGQYFVDPENAKRGPFTDAAARHQMYYSRYYNSSMFCSTCHDVSNPVLASLLIDLDAPETRAAASYFHVERTFSEFMLSAYNDGASTDIPGVSYADKCQDCHMRDVTGNGCNKKGAPTRTDLPLHDMTGGNQWVSRILASVDPNGPVYDPYNYLILSGQKYEGAEVDVDGIAGYGQALLDGADRALQQLNMASTLSVVSDGSTITIDVKNNAGHKLISGFPEGRRMFLNIKFYNDSGQLTGEVNPYEPLVTTKDPDGNEVYVSGGILDKTHDELVWEAEMSSIDITGEDKTFHFALATDRNKDNRIPPKGFDTANMGERLAQPRWGGTNASDYFTDEEYLGGYDRVTVEKPSDTSYWQATLYYQTTSKEYVEFLRDEINATPAHTTLPTEAYIAQTDPFFNNLKGWGNAVWDLWLHNGGAEPIPVATYAGGDVPEPPCTAPDTPQNLGGTAGKRDITLTWDPVTSAQGYNIYYSQNGKYTFVSSTSSTTYKDTRLTPGQTYCYAVTAFLTCDQQTLESDYSNEVCVTIPGRGKN